jgi:DHA1 family bicyclomycin/chloramphenicol resistance-like MFS transporter
VIARAVVRDVYDGSRAAAVFSQLMLVTGLAPVVGPMVGGQLLAFTDWRGIFVALGAIAAVLLVACWRLLMETRPAAVRAAAPRRSRALRFLLADRHLRGFLAMSALFGVVLFTYISMSAFVLQEDYGLGPIAYAWLFGANSVGLVLGSQLGARLVRRVGATTTLTCGVLVTSGATTVSGAALVLSAPLAVLVVPLWLVLAGLGMSFGTSTALALSPHPADAGAAAALLGASQFLLGAAVPPLVSLAGASGPTMGLTMGAAGLGLLAALRVTLRGRPREPATGGPAH